MSGELKHNATAAGSSLDRTDWESDSIHTLDGAEQGDLIFYNGQKIVRLPHGDSGQVLQSGGHGANPLWGSPLNEGLFGDGSDGDVTISADTDLTRRLVLRKEHLAAAARVAHASGVPELEGGEAALSIL